MDYIQWYDFRRFIERNAQPYAQLHFDKHRTARTDCISIYDISQPRRDQYIKSAQGHEADWHRDSFVCNAGWLHGAIPVRDISGKLEKDENMFRDENWPMRGARSVAMILRDTRVLRNTREVADLIELSLWRPWRYE